MTKFQAYNEDFYRLLLEQASAIVVCWGLDGHIKFVNKFCAEFFGFTQDELQDAHVVGTIVPQYNSNGEITLPTIEEIARNPGRYQSNVSENIKKDGERAWVSWTNKVLTGPMGDQLGAISIGVDITAQRKLEEELKQSQKMQTVGLLAGGVAHDFNNLLQGVSGYAELIADTDSVGLIHEYTQKIIIATEQASELTDRLLNFARKEGAIRKNLDVSEIVQESIELVRTTIKANVEIVFEPPLESIKSELDKGGLVSALVNLLINAGDAIGGVKRGIITVDISALEFLEAHKLSNGSMLSEGRYVAIKVGDNGRGIPESSLKQIFDPFFTSKHPENGTGLGLSNAYSVADAHGGAIDCQSVVGEGTTFTLYLHLNHSGLKADKGDSLIGRDARCVSIMLIDDEPLVRDFSKVLFEKKGHYVSVYESGAAGVEAFEACHDKLEVVIVDMLMPGMDGIEVLESLTKISKDKLFILATGYASGEQLSRARGAGFHKILRKPFKYADLEAILVEFDGLLSDCKKD